MRESRITLNTRIICGFLAAILCIRLVFPLFVKALPMGFDTFRLGDGDKAVLVLGGIQGDEPGGFSAATLLATRYEILKGALWVVPNLNFPSIIKRSRGLYGDMNRKFLALDEKDPEYATVNRVQSLIKDPAVRLVLNLHDGSGYYRPQYEDRLKNPGRWGQSIIIDQEKMDPDIFMGALASEGSAVALKANENLLAPEHAIHVHNTRTADGDKEMEKSLSYYAVRNKIAAFGIEASKELSVAQRAYYHLLMVEGFLKLAGIEFHRDFELTPKGVEKALKENLGVSFAGNRIFLPLENARNVISYLPMTREWPEKAITSKPIMAVIPCEKNRNRLCVHYGNRLIAVIHPDWRDAADGLDAIRVVIDGEEKLATFGQIVNVSRTAHIKKIPGYRVNVIGFDKGAMDESGMDLKRSDFKSRFSLDKAGTIYRVEVYKDKNFAGMFLLRFVTPGQKTAAKAILPDSLGAESSLGY